ncbi:MAG: hypothetical protein JWO82_738, partial [Akkermansiaceae bacterium]|nr:hypothetical protein [Akkermansiaceae bacterium]
NEEMARDVSQRTLIRLAERAALVPRNASLAAWLHRITRDLAVDLIRAEDRRKRREAAALLNPSAAMDEMPEPAWSALTPFIDEAVAHLPAADRDLILLRFYQNQPHAVIARQLGLTEQAARKRSLRALEKIRVMLGKRGIATTASALWTLLPAHAATPVPAALMTTMLSGVHGVAPLPASALQTTFHAMNATRKSLVAGAAVLFLASFGYAVRPVVLSPPPLASRAPGHDPAAGLAGRPARSGRPAPATPEERLARLKEILAMPSLAERRREMIAFAGALPLAAFPEVDGDFAQLDPRQQDYSPELDLLLLTWTKIDGPGALRSFEAAGDAAPHPHAFIRALAVSDPGTALKWAGSDRERLDSVLPGIASMDLEEALRIVRTQPEDPRAELLSSICFETNRQPGILRRVLEDLPAGDARSNLIARTAGTFSLSDPVYVFDRLLDDPAALARSRAASMIDRLAKVDMAAASAAVNRFPAGPMRQEALTGLMRYVMETQPEKGEDLLRQHPGAASPDSVSCLMFRQLGRDPDAAFAKLQLLPDEEMRHRTLQGVLSIWLRSNLKDQARAWVDSHEIPADIRSQLPGQDEPADENTTIWIPAK